MMIFTSYFDSLVAAILAEHLGSGGFSGPLYNLNLALLSAGIQLAPDTPWGQLTEANYSGYARAPGVTWGVPILQGDGTYSILSALETFVASAQSAFEGNIVYGYALIDGANPPNIALFEMLDQPIPIQAPGDGFGIVLAVNFGANNGNSYSQTIAAT